MYRFIIRFIRRTIGMIFLISGSIAAIPALVVWLIGFLIYGNKESLKPLDNILNKKGEENEARGD